MAPRVVLIAGPPCAGKSTYALERAAESDVIVDYDMIARSLGSPKEWQHDEPFKTLTKEAVANRLSEIASVDVSTVWVIRCLPDRRRRAGLIEELGAEIVLLDPGEAECLRRARTRPSGTRKAIRMWYWRDRVSMREAGA